MSCNPEICLKHGDCIMEPIIRCSCDVGWFEKDCDKNIEEYYPKFFFAYKIIFTILFFLLLILCIKSLNRVVIEAKTMHYLKGWTLLYKICMSPINISMIFISIISSLRIIWLLIDPFSFRKKINLILERLLNETIYSFLFALFAIILLVWYILFDELSYNINKQRRKIWICRCFRFILKTRVFIVFSLQILASILKRLRLGTEIKILCDSIYILLYFLLIIFIVEFFIYGILVNKVLKDIDIDSKKDKKKKYIQNIIEENLDINNNQNKKEKEKKITVNFDNFTKKFKSKKTRLPKSNLSSPKKFFSGIWGIKPTQSYNIDSKRKTILNGNKSKSIEKKIQSKNVFIFNENNEEIKMEKSSILHPEACELFKNTDTCQNDISFMIDNPKDLKNWNVDIDQRNIVNEIEKSNFEKSLLMCNITSPQKRDQDFLPKPLEQIIPKLDHSKFGIQEIAFKKRTISQDKKILRKIFSLTLLGVLMEVCFALLSLSAGLAYDDTTPNQLLIFLYSSGFLEFASCFIIFGLFSNEKSKEMNNLRWISKIGSQKNEINKFFIFKIPDDHDIVKDNSFNIILQNRINFLSSFGPDGKTKCTINKEMSLD